jgi:putative sterol carrier protein
MVASDAVFKKIEARLAKIDASERKVLHSYKFILTDDAGTVVKTWILDLKNVKLYEGTEEAECTLKLKESTIMAIVDGSLDSTKALNDDLIDVEGNLELLSLLKPYISSL